MGNRQLSHTPFENERGIEVKVEGEVGNNVVPAFVTPNEVDVEDQMNIPHEPEEKSRIGNLNESQARSAFSQAPPRNNQY